MSHRYKIALVLAVLALSLATQGAALAQPGMRTAAGNNEFALMLYARLRSQPGNLIVSPFSIRAALGMTCAGARNRTKSQMEKVLRLAGVESPHQSLARLSQALVENASKSGCVLSIANSLWGQKDYGFLQEYVGFMRSCYGGAFSEVDFRTAPEVARKTINSWVHQKTGNVIEEFIRPGDLSPLVQLVLANAIHFRGSWARTFDRKSTRDRSFYVPAGPEPGAEMRRVPVPTMYQNSEFDYHRGRHLAVLELPYAGGKFSMVILLPHKRDGLAALEDSLTAPMLEGNTRLLKRQKVGVLLPRFKATTHVALDETLGAMGMPDAFSGQADFSGMTGKKELFIDKVVHEAVIEVDEQGTEAAGATAVMMAKGGNFFGVNRPFIFLVRERSTDAILFLGRIVDPSQSMSAGSGAKSKHERKG